MTVTSTEIVNEVQFNVYPNPAKDYLIIELSEGDCANGVLYNLNGAIIKIFEMHGTDNLSLSGIKAGIYILQIATEKHVFKTKLVISK